MNEMKRMVIAVSVFLSLSAFAEPDRIDIVGLIPSVTSLKDFDRISTDTKTPSYMNTKTKRNGYFDIGGYTLPCEGEFIDGRMEKFMCFTGSKNVYGHSNIEIHDVLRKGFEKKFGTPYSDFNTPASTAIGVEYTRNSVTWVDKQGNSLNLLSMVGNIDQGALMIISHTKSLKDDAERKRIEQERKF
jgi:hypothetical protein